MKQIYVRTRLFVGGWMESGKLVDLSELPNVQPWRCGVLEGIIDIRIGDTFLLGEANAGRVDIAWPDIVQSLVTSLRTGLSTGFIGSPNQVWLGFKRARGRLVIRQRTPESEVFAEGNVQEVAETLLLGASAFWDVVDRYSLIDWCGPDVLAFERKRIAIGLASLPR